MNDLISRSALKKYVNDHSTHWLNEWDTAGVLLAVQNAPAVDAVEVVRCKNCKHWNKDALACDGLPWVSSSEHVNWYAEDFCSYGERRADDG